MRVRSLAGHRDGKRDGIQFLERGILRSWWAASGDAGRGWGVGWVFVGRVQAGPGWRRGMGYRLRGNDGGVWDGFRVGVFAIG